MADITISRGNTLPDSSAKSDFHNLIDQATASIANITGNDISAITQSNKVAGSALYNLYSIISGASIPSHALADVEQLSKVSAYSLYNLSSLPTTAGIIESPQVISAASLKNLGSLPSLATQFPYKSIVSSLASGGSLIYDGINNLVGGGSSSINFKVGNFSRDVSTATGTQAITGVGFQPSVVIAIESINDTASWSVGFSDGSSHRGINGDPSGADRVDTSSSFIECDQGSGNVYSGVIDSFDADGFTVSWTKSGSPTGTATISYLAIG